jgi:hypothetical protein
MILKFKFKDDYWERAAYSGPNHFVKSLPPNKGYQNHGLGGLPKAKPGGKYTTLTDDFLNEMLRRKQVIILEEYIKDEHDTDQQQEGLSDSGSPEVSPTIE